MTDHAGHEPLAQVPSPSALDKKDKSASPDTSSPQSVRGQLTLRSKRAPKTKRKPQISEAALQAVRAGANLEHLMMEAGLQLERRGRRLVGLCPFHNDKKTPSLSIEPLKGLWYCFGCDRGGDAIAFVEAWERIPFVEVVQRLADSLGVDPEDEAAKAPKATISKGRPPISSKEPIAPRGIEDVWEHAASIDEDEQAIAWLQRRKLDPSQVAFWDLARVLRPPLPAWAFCQKRNWQDSGHRLLIPLFDPKGTLTSVRARRILGGEGLKALAPAGHRTTGLVMACPVARQMLQGQPVESLKEMTGGGRLIVCEGGPDFLLWASKATETNASPAVISVISGSWSPVIAKQIPEGFKVVIRTHDDEKGHGFFTAIEKTLKGRCELYSVRGKK